jgi:hypothetical protein
MSKNLRMTFAAMTRPAEELCLGVLLTLKAKNSLCLLGTRTPTVSMMEWQLILPLKALMINKASRCRME